MSDTTTQNPLCATCKGPLKRANTGWMHVYHHDFIRRPHHSVPEETPMPETDPDQ